MNATDFLTILGLGLAVWAIIPKRERNFVLLFFSKTQILLFILGLIYLHFLFAFDWLVNNWFSHLTVFTSENGIPSSTWAYLLSLIIVVVPVLKVLYGFFSPSRRKEVISLYNSLLRDDDIDLLVTYIKKYHIVDIRLFLKGLSHLPEKENIDKVLRQRTETDEAFDKLIRPTRIKFAASVYGSILQSEIFVEKTVQKYPELLATAFSGMETEKAANENLVKFYIEQLFEFKNQSFISELKIVNDSNSSIEDINKRYDIPILYGLLSHTKAAYKNYVWYPIGEKGVKSLKYDEGQREFLLKKYDSDLESELWNQKIYIAIVYFNYMVRETIYKNSEWHMWLFYYRYFNDLLIEILPSENEFESTSERPSFAHSLIFILIGNMRGWLELAKEKDVVHRVIDTVRCLGTCLDSICNAPSEKLSPSFKKRQLNLIISLWFDYSRYPDNAAARLSREWLVRMFLNPSRVDSETANLSKTYLNLFQETWKEFDKVPFQMFEDNGSITEFNKSVLTPLGIEN